MRGIPSLGGAKDSIANLVFGRLVGGRCDDDDARELGAGDPREGRLMLVFPSNLEEVEEVSCSRVDSDQVFVWGWVGVWEGGNNEVLRALFDDSLG